MPRINREGDTAAGIDFGLFHHELPDPRPEIGFNDGWGPADVQTIRRETRLETSVSPTSC